MSTYKFKVSDPSEIDIPRICRENADQDAFVIIYGDKIHFAVKSELNTRRQILFGPSIVPNWLSAPGDAKQYEGFVFGWYYVGEARDDRTTAEAEERATTFFRRVANSRDEINRKKKKQLVTVIAKD